jgi:xylulokinase
VRGAFLRLDNETTPEKLAQSVLEGVAFALADGLDALRGAGTVVNQLSVIGGGARSTYWGGILAAALEAPLVYLQGGEVGPALGAARLAQVAVDRGDPVTVCAAPPVARTVEPDAGLVERLAEKKQAFRDAYPRITPKKGI